MSDFVKYDLGELESGAVVTVAVRERVNVRFLDVGNFHRYQRGQQYRCLGGHALSSPVTLQVPHPDHWFVALDSGGGTGTIHSNVTVTR
jgi:hypothetical protein